MMMRKAMPKLLSKQRYQQFHTRTIYSQQAKPEGKILAYYVKPGDTIQQGQLVCSHT
jgi:biotin carboxyl carrier protein